MLRVCILAKENVLHWIPFYVEAFRQTCDVITIGPALDVCALGDLGREATAALRVPNDIVTDETDAIRLMEMLPEGWTPDLVVGIQSGSTAYQCIAHLSCPTAYISVDTWHAPEQFFFALDYDYVFCAQKVFVPYFRQAGSRRVFWLPLACAPDHHVPVPVNQEYDIVFVGTTGYVVDEERVRRIIRLNEAFDVARQEGVGAEEMSRTYCTGRLAFNSSIAQDVNMRVFEVMGTGRPLLTNRDADVNGLLELFEDGRHLITYDDTDLMEKARYYLAHEEEREAIGRAGREEVLERHTYRHRIDTLIETVASYSPLPDDQAQPLLRGGGRLSQWLPHGAEKVIDIGAGMDRSKLALRKRGVRRFSGVVRDEATLEKRRRSYDDIYLWPSSPDISEAADAVLWTTPLTWHRGMPEVLAHGHAMLADGGALVLRMNLLEMDRCEAGASEESWREWLPAHGFYLAAFERSPEWIMLILRRYSRPVDEIADEIYARFPGGHLSARKGRQQV